MNSSTVLAEVLVPVFEETLGEKPVTPLDPTTRLLGPNAPFDSMRFVSFIVAVEERLIEKTGIELTLASEKAMSLSKSPFRSLGSLAEYIAEELAGYDQLQHSGVQVCRTVGEPATGIQNKIGDDRADELRRAAG